MIYKVSIRYADTGDIGGLAGEVTVRGATVQEADERLQALIDWLPDHMVVVLRNSISLYQ